jgi:hypothetical protein
MSSASEPLVAYRAADMVEARALVAYLAEAGVESRVLGEPLAGAYGGVSAGGLDQLEVWIAAKDEPEARELIAEWRAETAAARAKAIRTSEDAVRENSASSKPDASPSRRAGRPQFSLATALVATTAVAITAALVGRNVVDWSELPGFVGSVAYLGIISALIYKHFRARAVQRREAEREEPS